MQPQSLFAPGSCAAGEGGDRDQKCPMDGPGMLERGQEGGMREPERPWCYRVDLSLVAKTVAAVLALAGSPDTAEPTAAGTMLEAAEPVVPQDHRHGCLTRCCRPCRYRVHCQHMRSLDHDIG